MRFALPNGCRLTSAARYATVVAGLALLAGCQPANSTDSTGPSNSSSPTFTQDIAPILFEQCVTCHRPGQSAPFSLLTYQQVAAHGRQIAEVTRSRYMPPWMPRPGPHSFRGERRLRDDQIDVIEQWVEAGLPEGDPAALPAAPEFSDDWQLGSPDLVLSIPEPYQLAAGSIDVFRNFVIPVPIEGQRYVKSLEFRAGNPRIVHHAELRVDRSSASRNLDAADAEPGFPGMHASSESPGGLFLGWTPGRVPLSDDQAIVWPLEEGTDLVMLMHLLPTGKEEGIQPQLGLRFTDQPPRQLPFAIWMDVNYFNIAPGETNYRIQRSYTLPVDVELHSVYPHAHYLGKHVLASARYPDGKQVTLIEIADWDFNWQDQYWYETPLSLPRGTTITMDYIYDNSAENPRNPTIPPQRVKGGPRSTDEMGALMLQVLVRRPEDLAALKADIFQYRVSMNVRDYQQAVENDPQNAEAHQILAYSYSRLNKPSLAVTHYTRAAELRTNPTEKAQVLHDLAITLADQGRRTEAIERLREAVTLQLDQYDSHFVLGSYLLEEGLVEESLKHYERGLSGQPNRADMLIVVGTIYAGLQQYRQAVEHYRRAATVDPDNWQTPYLLGNVAVAEKRTVEAADHYRRAVELRPDAEQPHYQLGMLHLKAGDTARAIAEFQRAVAIRPAYAEAHYGLGEAYLRQGDQSRAVAEFRRAVRAPSPSFEAALRLARILLTSQRETGRGVDEALALAEGCARATQFARPDVLDLLAEAQAAAGNLAQAAESSRRALRLASEQALPEWVERISARLAELEARLAEQAGE